MRFNIPVPFFSCVKVVGTERCDGESSPATDGRTGRLREGTRVASGPIPDRQNRGKINFPKNGRRDEKSLKFLRLTVFKGRSTIPRGGGKRQTNRRAETAAYGRERIAWMLGSPSDGVQRGWGTARP
jgi:hypothetical protein